MLDPFAGSGAVLAQTAFMRRKYLGVELNNKYIEQFNQYLKNNLQKGLKEYEINKLAPDQIQFETVIWQLRALKYGRVLLNSLEKTTGTNRLKVVVSQQDIRNGKIVVGYTFITTAPLIETIEALVQEFINSKPLKLYGILPVINYIEPGMQTSALPTYIPSEATINLITQ